MRIEDALVHGLALATIVVLFIVLAHALDGRPRHAYPAIGRRGIFGFPLTGVARAVDPFIPIAGTFPAASSMRGESLPGDESPFLPGPLIRIRPAVMHASPAPPPPAPALAAAGEVLPEPEVVLEEVVLEEVAPEPAETPSIVAAEMAVPEPAAVAAPLVPVAVAAESSSHPRMARKRGARRDADPVLVDVATGEIEAAPKDTESLDGGDPDRALEPLLEALRVGGGDAVREAEARRALTLAVDGLVDRLETETLERLREGDLTGAMADSRRLSEVLDRALECGLSQEDLAAALGRRQELLLQIAAG